MTVSPSLAGGEHVLFPDPAFHWEAAVSDTSPPGVVLTASIRVAPAAPGEPRSTATVALRMDSQVALQLYGKLYALVRAQGWLPEE